MKTITLHVDEAVYSELQEHAREAGRSASELVREAMVAVNEQMRRPARGSLVSAPPAASVGKILRPWKGRADLLDDFLDNA